MCVPMIWCNQRPERLINGTFDLWFLRGGQLQREGAGASLRQRGVVSAADLRAWGTAGAPPQGRLAQGRPQVLPVHRRQEAAFQELYHQRRHHWRKSLSNKLYVFLFNHIQIYSMMALTSWPKNNLKFLALETTTRSVNCYGPPRGIHNCSKERVGAEHITVNFQGDLPPYPHVSSKSWVFTESHRNHKKWMYQTTWGVF